MKAQKLFYKTVYCDLQLDQLFMNVDKNRGLAKKLVIYRSGFLMLVILNPVHGWDDGP